MLQSFFITDTHPPQCIANALFTHTKLLRTLSPIGIGISPDITRQCDAIDLGRRFIACAARLETLQPTHNSGNTNIKPGRHLGNRKAFLLANRQNLTAKIMRVSYLYNIINLYGPIYIKDIKQAA
jgi:hypothetical protein